MANRIILLIALLLSISTFAQVDGIKRESGARSKSSGDGRSGHSSGGRSSVGASLAEGFFQAVFFVPFSAWQQQKLSKANDLPWLRSAELFVQGAAQPSNYYVVTPRIRGTYGLFSTDFRLNWLIEEDFDGAKMLHTYDWQVIQLNVVTTSYVTGRIGAGILTEGFGDNKTYGEWATSLRVHPPRQSWSTTGEFRAATSRKEGSLFAERIMYEQSRFHLSLSLGGIYQRYYGTIDVWGVQVGAIARLY